MTILTPNFHEAANKAAARIADSGTDIAQLARDVRMGSPGVVASEEHKQRRRQMLENLYSEEREAQQAFERIIGGNELQDANYLPRGTLVARSVVRVIIRNERGRRLGFGSGFFVGDGVLMTNNHVLKNEELARASEIELFYERDLLGQDRTPFRFRLRPDRLFYTSEPLDFTIVAVEEEAIGGQLTLDEIGWLPLIAELGKVMEGEWLTIIQHPNGERKQLCARDNQFLARSTDVLWYSTDTLGGSSGSPVFTNDWLVVALHHSGVPRIVDGVWKTVNGEDYDPSIHSDADIDWVANEGIRISKIIELLRTDLQIANHPLIAPMLNVGVRDISARLPVMFRGGKLPESLVQIARSVSFAEYMKPMDAADAQSTLASRASNSNDTIQVASGKEDNMGRQLIQVTLAVENGQVEVVEQEMSASEVDVSGLLESKKKNTKPPHAPVDPRKHWGKPFDEYFLYDEDTDDEDDKEAKRVHLPVLDEPAWSAEDEKPTQEEEEWVRRGMGKIAPLLKANGAPQTTRRAKDAYGLTPSADDVGHGRLHYKNFTLAMNSERRMAYYSAANVDGGVNWGLDRPADKWLNDERIDSKHQLREGFYKYNVLDIGHLSRREALEWGKNPFDATLRANATNVLTNAVPQFKTFNRNQTTDKKKVLLWQGLEQYILEQTAREYKFRVQVMTGPIFEEFDPEYKGVKLPLEFWKVVVAVDDKNDLFATAFVLSHERYIDPNKIDDHESTPTRDKFFTEWKSYQRSIEEIEKLTKLKFRYGPDGASLAEKDPFAKELEKEPWRRRTRRRVGDVRESIMTSSNIALQNDGEINSFDDIILG